MAAATHDIEINQGATFTLAFRFKDSTDVPIDLTSATIESQIRPSADSKIIIAEFAITKDPIVVGRVVLSLAADKTALMDFEKAAYDLLVTLGADKTRYIQGTVTLSKQITR